MKYQKQELFSHDPKTWEEEWQGMPEFIVENASPFKEIKVKFSCAEDYKEFMKLIKQPLTMKTISIWYPAVYQRQSRREWRYVNEEE